MRELADGEIEILSVRPIGAGLVACEVRTSSGASGNVYFGAVADDIKQGDIRKVDQWCRVGAILRADPVPVPEPAG